MAHRFDPKNIGKLESPERKRMLPVDEILTVLQIGDQDVIADMGAGAGYFTLPLARKAKQVLAVDIEPQMLGHLSQKIDSEGLENVEMIKSDIIHTPLSDESCDKLLCSLVMHEVEDVAPVTREFFRILKKDGIAMIVDWKKEPMEEGPPVKHRLAAAVVKQSMEQQSFVPEEENDLEKFYVLTFRKM